MVPKCKECPSSIIEGKILSRKTLKVGSIDLSKLVDWDVISLNIGDWVTVIDEDLGCNIKARVTKLTIYPEFSEKTQ